MACEPDPNFRAQVPRLGELKAPAHKSPSATDPEVTRGAPQIPGLEERLTQSHRSLAACRDTQATGIQGPEPSLMVCGKPEGLWAAVLGEGAVGVGVEGAVAGYPELVVGPCEVSNGFTDKAGNVPSLKDADAA